MSAELVGIVAPAWLAGLLVLLTHAPLGRQVLQRGIIFVDLAVAQAAATGALASQLLLHDSSVAWQQGGALLAALAASAVLHPLSRHHADIQEALIGGGFVVLASVAVLLVSQDPHGGDHLHSLLSGQLLWVSTAQLLWLALGSGVCLVLMWRCRHPLGGFYIPLALAVTLAVQAVGVYLVFACLVFPALATRRLPVHAAHGHAILAGALALAAGLAVSVATDLPSAPVCVLALALGAWLGSRLHSIRPDDGLQSGRHE